MNPGGVLVVLAGVWLGCQIFGGHMLERLGIVSDTSKPATGGTAGAVYRPTAPTATVMGA